ncbi:MAG: bifunctional diguanylate cyclase/phosphodiesterase, partial [Clostridia bacterium]
PVAVVSAKSELLLHITLLLCGFIVLAFGTLTIALATSFYKHKHSLESLAFVDPITGGNTIQKFYEDAWPLLQKAADKVYALIYMNIEKFKVLNEQFGKKACDELLRGIHEGISTDLADDECMGRLSADNFCILVRFENEDALIARFAKWRSNTMAYIESIGSLWLPQNAEFGVFVIDDAALPLAHMIDRAKLSLTEATSTLRDKMRYAIFNEKVRHALLREKQLEDAMEDALAAREFTVYLQPKYDTQTERIGGAEALVRWKSPTEGMIYPDEFIPLFEKNSFVVQIDLFVFEEICRLLERWVQDGLPLIKVSVNCSRAQLRIPNFLESYRQIMQKYVFPANMLEIELTETVVFEDVAALSAVIREIHALGLGCSMDDFGSGYSSLNLIRHIPVDTLKLDKVFFRTTPEDAERTESVVGSIITMAKALHMSTVAEGVEQRAQVDMLKRLGCDSIQGYYFARPMPISAFDQLRLAERAQIEKTKLA